MAEQVIATLREQLAQAWAINEQLVRQIDELKTNELQNNVYQAPRWRARPIEPWEVSDKSDASSSRAPAGSRVFRWPKSRRITQIGEGWPDPDLHAPLSPPAAQKLHAYPGSPPRIPPAPSLKTPSPQTKSFERIGTASTQIEHTPSPSPVLESGRANKNFVRPKLSPARSGMQGSPHLIGPIRLDADTTGDSDSEKAMPPPSKRPVSRRRVHPTVPVEDMSGVISDEPKRAKKLRFTV